MWVEFLKTKDEAFSRFKKIQVMAEAEKGCKLRAFRSDRGGEFNSLEFSQYCEEWGMKHFTTAPYTPQQNGVVEHRNRTVVEMARCLLKARGVPIELWGEAVATAVYLLNRALTRSLKMKTPYEAWYDRKPKVHHFRTFGCLAHVKNIGPGIGKLSDRSKKMMFVGYETGSKAYRLYDPVLKKLHVSRDVLFEEKKGWDWNKNQQSEPVRSTLEVEFYSIAKRETVPEDSEFVTDGAADPVQQGGDSPSTIQWSVDAESTNAPHLSTPPGSPVVQGVEFATPLTGQSVDSEGVPMRYRTVTN